MESNYTTTHNDWDPNLVFPFVVSRFKRDQIYIDPKWGIKIEEIRADGDLVVPRIHDVDLDDLNFRRLPIGGDPFIYQVRYRDLVFAKSFSEEGDYELLKYTIPEASKLVVLQYRLREASNSVGPVMALHSRLV